MRQKKGEDDRRTADKVVALAGNPNVGKSTLFNALTGLKQHTGNWPGKTVVNASGCCQVKECSYELVDLPGTYSLLAHSAEEEVARNFLCFGGADAVVVVCDASCLQRNLNLVLQTLEITDRVLVCVNLLDEAKKKQLRIDLEKLSELLGVPVTGTVARKKKSLCGLLKGLEAVTAEETGEERNALQVRYAPELEEAVACLEPAVKEALPDGLNSRFVSLKLLEGEKTLLDGLTASLQKDLREEEGVKEALKQARAILAEKEIGEEELQDMLVTGVAKEAERIGEAVVQVQNPEYRKRDQAIDRVVTGSFTGYPIMLLLLAFIFWLTIEGANYPSSLLAQLFFFIQERLTELFAFLGAPEWLHGMLVLGVYRVVAWVVSVMLPPMAIFFPLFTLLEDFGYLPRIAYNLDGPFKRCNACGKQALTMCMGFGCNAAGVVGCRIIDSKRERLLAVLTNSFVPCNGRFPTLLSMITMFFAVGGGISGSFSAALILTGFILAGILMTFLVSGVLSKTVLRGMPSAFTLELPPYRRPQPGKILVRSVLDRTLFVLGRAVLSAAPAGLFIWLVANVTVGGVSLLSHMAGFLEPFAALLGLDGVILLAFVLGIPANEIVLPIILMAYTAQGSLTELTDLCALKELLVSNGFTLQRALCMTVFCLFHWPCATTLLTIKKETGSLFWTLLAFFLPTFVGGVLCALLAAAFRLFAG